MSGAEIVGTPILANPPDEAGFQVNTSIVGLTGGRFVESWVLNGALYARIFGSDGVALTGEIAITPVVGPGGYNFVSLAPSGDGFSVAFGGVSPIAPVNYAILVETFDANGVGSGLRYANVDASGTPEQVSFNQQPVIASQPGGSSLVVWQDNFAGAQGNFGTNQTGNTDHDGFGILGKLFGTGAPAADFTINTSTVGDQGNPSVTALTNGTYLVSWTSTFAGISTIEAQVIDQSGHKIGLELVLALGNNASVAALADGNFAVAYQTAGFSDSHVGIFTPDGTNITPGGMLTLPRVAGAENAFLTAPVITALGNGDFAVATQNFSNIADMYVQVIDRLGNLVGGPLTLQDGATNNVFNPPGHPQLGSLGAGEFVISYTDVSGAIGDSDVGAAAQRLHVDSSPPATITAPTSQQAFLGVPGMLGPISIADPSAGNTRITVTLTDTTGLLSAHVAGAGTVSGAGTHTLTLTGTVADVNAELVSVSYQGAIAGAIDGVHLSVTDLFHAPVTADISVNVDEVPFTNTVVHGSTSHAIVPTAAVAIDGISVSNPYAEATGTPVVFDITTPLPGTLIAEGTGGAVIHQGTNHIQIIGSPTEINNYIGDWVEFVPALPVLAELLEKVHASVELADFLGEMADGKAANEAKLVNALVDLSTLTIEKGFLAPPAAFLEVGVSSAAYVLAAIVATIPGNGEAPSQEEFEDGLYKALSGKYIFDTLKYFGALPHIVTGDGTTYDMHAAGEFLLALSTRPGDPFQVQARLEPLNGSDSVSAATQIAVQVGSDRVTFDLHRADIVWVDGSPVAMAPGALLSLSAGQVGQLSATTFGVTLNTGEAVQVTNTGTSLDVRIGVGVNTDPDAIIGLSGSNEGAANDFQLPTGLVLPQPLTTAEFYNLFVNSWRVADSISILDYGAGQTTATFTNLNFPASQITLADLPQNLVQEAAALVAAAGITDPGAVAAAEFDYIATGGDLNAITNASSQFNGLVTTPATFTSSGPVPTAVGVIGSAAQSIPSVTNGPTPVTYRVYLTTPATHDTTIDYQVIAPGVGFFDATDFGGTLPSGQVTIHANDSTADIVVNVPLGAISAPSEKLAIQIATSDGTDIFAPTAVEIVAQTPQAGIAPVPVFASLANLGSFTHEGNHYTLDLGEIGVGQPLPPLQFELDNAAGISADQLGGTFSVLHVAGFKVSGAALPSPIDGGQGYQGLTVGVNTGAFDTTAPLKFGAASELITFHPVDTNESGYSAPLPDIDLTVKYDLVPANRIYSAAYGDVHILTYDQLHYDFQAVGEFTLAKSRVPGDTFDIQIRLQPWELNDAVTTIHQVAVSVGTDRITFDARRLDMVEINGAPTALSLANPVINLAHGQITEITSSFYKVTWDTGEEMTVNNPFGYLDVTDSVPLGQPGFIGGLQGFAEGQARDFQLPDGTVLPQPLDCDTLYGMYADAWRVTQAASLFDYLPGQTTTTFNDPAFPATCLDLSTVPAAVLNNALELAKEAGITDPTMQRDAAYDYIFTGSPAFITGAAQIDQKGFTGTTAPITMVNEPTGAGIAATAPKFVETPGQPTHATFTIFLTAPATADTVIGYAVAAPDASFLGAAAFGGTLPSGQVVIAAGSTTAQVTIDVPDHALGTLPSENLEVQITAGATPLVASQAITEIVNNEPTEGVPAAPALAYLGGVGALSHEGNVYTLDLGGVAQGKLVLPLQFAVLNAATGVADDLGGTFGFPTGDGFTVTGNNLPAPIAPGQSYQGLYFSANTSVIGTHTETLIFHAVDVNDSGFSSPLSDITLIVTDNVQPVAQAQLNTPDTILFPNVRVNTPDTQPVSFSNTAGDGAQNLGLSFVAHGNATVTGAIDDLAPGATDYTDVTAGLDTSAAGARSGYLTVVATSDGGGDNTKALHPDQFIDVFGSVYRLAAASVIVGGPITVSGGTGQVHLTVTNTDPNDGYSENLVATATGASGDFTLLGGTTGEIAAGASDTTTFTLTFSTTNAQTLSGVLHFSLVSDGGTGPQSIDGLGQFALGQIEVPITIVLNAPPELEGDTLTLREGATKTITSDDLTIVDPDNTDAELTITVTQLPDHGTLLANGVALVAGSTFTQADVDNNVISYRHDGSETDSDQFFFNVSDGAGGTLDQQEFFIGVFNTNDAPVNTVPGAQSVLTGTQLTIAGVSVFDADAGEALIQTTLTVSHGTLSVTASGAIVSGLGTHTVTIQGSQSGINATLAGGVLYTPDAGFLGNDSLDVLTNDNGHSVPEGEPPALTDLDSVAIKVHGLNTAPIAQGGVVNGTEDVVVHGSLVAGDSDGDPLTFGSVTAPQHGALTVHTDGSYTYTPDGNYFGPDSFTFQASDGIETSNVATVSLFLDPVNDAPINVLPAAESFEANVGGAITGLSIIDDSGQGIIATTLSVRSGILKIGVHEGVAISGNGSDTVTLRGILDDINAVLAAPDGVHYTSPRDFFANDTLTFKTNDEGNTGTGGPLSDTDTMAIDLVTTKHGTNGNDSLHAGPGNELLLGGLGDDTVTFDFKLVDAKVTYEGHLIIVDGPSSHTVLSGFEVFNFADGTVHNDDNDPLVDDLFYYSQNHDVWNAHADADSHYHTVGWKEGRDPNAFFDTRFYLGVYHDVVAAGVDPLVDFDQNGWKQGRLPSTDFDPKQYLAQNPDVAANGGDPLAHFLHNGMEEGRIAPHAADPLASNGFDYAYYLLHNPDVAASGMDPFAHYETIGWKEGRNPNAFFDDKGYLATYADVAASGMNPLDHYHEYGWREGRDPSINFDTKSYLAANSDVAAAHVDPLTHYLQYGIYEGRTAFADGHFG